MTVTMTGAEGDAPARLFVSIVAPVYNEAAVLPEFIARLAAQIAKLRGAADFEIVLVDDGSRDGSVEAVKSHIATVPGLRLVVLRRNYGQTAALQAGIDTAAGDYVITMDADLQHFPEEIPLFLAKIGEGYDVVCGWRRTRREGIVRRWPSRVANALMRRISGVAIHDIGTTYRIYRREILRDIRLLGENHRFIPVLASAAGAQIAEVEITNIERPVGKSNYGIGRSVSVFLDLFFLMFYLRYMDRPLRMFGSIGLLAIAAGIAIAATLLGMAVFYGIPAVHEHVGWAGLSALLCLVGLQVVLAGFLGEMLSRIYFNRGETTYKIRHIWPK